MKIHPLAVVSPSANIAPGVQIGPFCVIESDVTLGEDCVLESRVVIRNGTTLGPNNHVFEGAVLGGLPQHIHMPETPGKLIIGSGNTLRENCTIHVAMEPDHATVIGDNNLVMGNAHLAHDCRLGNHVILTNNVMLAGHTTIADRAFLSGAAALHQFVRVGALAMVGGQAHMVKDVPPFVTVDGLSSLVVGLNQVGLRRAGYKLDEIRQLKAAYRVIYRSGLTWDETLQRLQAEFSEGPAVAFHEFLSTTKRGITSERHTPAGATLKLRTAEPESELRAKAG